MIASSTWKHSNPWGRVDVANSAMSSKMRRAGFIGPSWFTLPRFVSTATATTSLSTGTRTKWWWVATKRSSFQFASCRSARLAGLAPASFSSAPSMPAMSPPPPSRPKASASDPSNRSSRFNGRNSSNALLTVKSAGSTAAAAAGAAATALLVANFSNIADATLLEEEETNKSEKKQSAPSPSDQTPNGGTSLFPSAWIPAVAENLDSFWKQRVRDSHGGAEPAADPSTPPQEQDDRPYENFFQDAAAFLTGAFGNSSQEAQEQAVQRLVDHVRRGQGSLGGGTSGSKPDGGDVRDKTSFADILSLLHQQVIGDVTATSDGDDPDELKSRLDRVADKYLGDRLSSSFVAALAAYLEHEDEVKNPSWKRRMHRYCPGIRMQQLEELYRALLLAYYAYGDTEDEIRSNLERRGYELLYCDLTSAPGRPAHYVAVQRSSKNKTASGDKSWFSLLSSSSSSSSSSGLPVVIVVRGTKTLADVLTDLLCESCEYRGGKAHAYIVAGGRYLAQKQAPMLRQLAEISGMDLRVTLVGHSLGAGAATIAGIELANDRDRPCAVSVMGFGCPALLSRDLAEQVSSYVTTVINDADVVPRMSGASIANLLTEVSAFDWLPYVKRDIQHALDEFFPAQVSESIMSTVEPHLKSVVESSRKVLPEQARLAPELYPPGRCIHFYSDGNGVSAAVVPNDFFKEIDVNRRMIDDHLFFRGYQRMMLTVMRDYVQDHNFRFEADE